MFSIASSRILQSCANFSIIVVTMKETIFLWSFGRKKDNEFQIKKVLIKRLLKCYYRYCKRWSKEIIERKPYIYNCYTIRLKDDSQRNGIIFQRFNEPGVWSFRGAKPSLSRELCRIEAGWMGGFASQLLKDPSVVLCDPAVSCGPFQVV